MIQEAITDQLTGMVPDLIAVAAAFLAGIIIMRSFKPESVTPHIARPFIRHTLPKFAEFKSVVRAIEFNG
ncbi:hypothetical protein [Methylomonas rapida]|uniref:Uncharacterized protein n=1 Tax=Methylomonas rapida TaxID=2963939 RepID=A0ABY7GDV9_9GAMM|nr:hypothetical protein [Methylomonas rapida]WAR42979.1 hypothetical protein NM686_011245 [Methylomonas rapida]